MHQDNLVTLDPSAEFHSTVSQQLQTQIQQRHSVVLLGMKRVGISNFLRHFLAHEPPARATTHPERRIVVDLNNLIERSIYAFWVLTLKKVVDEILSGPYETDLQDEARTLFSQSIQLHDSFFTLHALQRLLSLLSEQGIWVTFFFLRFDRLQIAMTSQFANNLVGLRDAVPGTVYVVTSHRPLHEIAPEVFPKISTQSFFLEQYVPPLNKTDSLTVLRSLQNRYNFTLSEPLCQQLMDLSGGHVQLLHQAVLRLKHEPQMQKDMEKLRETLSQDETIQFLCEEIWSSLTSTEQETLISLAQQKSLDKTPAEYLLQTGILLPEKNSFKIPIPLLNDYVTQRFQRTVKNGGPEFTKKEYLFFEILLNAVDQLVERDTIIEHVWPDEYEYGISDWAVDRLAARVRRKLLDQAAPYKLKTVVSRGYKLVATVPLTESTSGLAAGDSA